MGVRIAKVADADPGTEMKKVALLVVELPEVGSTTRIDDEWIVDGLIKIESARASSRSRICDAPAASATPG